MTNSLEPAKKLVEQYKLTSHPEQILGTVSIIERIQLDAMYYGMLHAANVVSEMSQRLDGQVFTYPPRDQILKAAKALTARNL